MDNIEFWAAFVHGFTAAFHFLGLAFNIRKRNWPDAAVHTLALIYDSMAMRRHMKRLREQKSISAFPYSMEREL